MFVFCLFLLLIWGCLDEFEMHFVCIGEIRASFIFHSLFVLSHGFGRLDVCFHDEECVEGVDVDAIRECSCHWRLWRRLCRPKQI
ncbi:hypothetical protein HanPI659440_Chr15g0587351 [Helianthus annuus]|nr:hypothetical protein HanPI659440_Chr15g0587351 [Helianthus annuus]